VFLFQIKVVQNIKTHVLGSIAFSPENLTVYEIMRKKYCTARWATDDNIIRRRKDAFCMLDNYDKNTDTYS
jgi:hypothetical protein